MIGCSATPQLEKPVLTPYKVVRTLESSRVLKVEDLPLGITQAKISETNYLITAKLGAYSKVHRAHSMALLHAANLAIENGYAGFVVEQFQKGAWCQTLRTCRKEFIQDSNGGVTTRLVASFSNDPSLKNYKNVTKVYPFHQSIIDEIQSDEELIKIATDRTERCLKQAQKRTGRRLLNNQ